MLRLVLGGLLASLARGWTPQDTNAAVKSVDGALRNAPCVVLVRPRLDENVGAVARAMANFGLADLRLVAPAPTCDWRSEAAARRACGAHAIPSARRRTRGSATRRRLPPRVRDERGRAA